MKIVCMDCKKELGEKEGGEGITHGLCPECYEKRLLEIVKIRVCKAS